LLGIDETDEKPPRAKRITPLPHCHDLAQRLRDQVRDWIEPKLAMAIVRGVETDEKGGGVVVFRIPESQHAPHRSKSDLKCYIRRDDRSEQMTMREIQDLTLLRDRGTLGVEQRFRQRSLAFSGQFETLHALHTRNLLAARVTLLPLGGALDLGRVFGRKDLEPAWGKVDLIPGKPACTVGPPLSLGERRPILRGVKHRGDVRGVEVTLSIEDDGVVEIVHIETPQEENEAYLYVGNILAYVLNGLLTADRVRRVGGQPELGYGMEIELRSQTAELMLGDFPYHLSSGGPIQRATHDNPLELPRFSFGERSEIATIVGYVCQDLSDATGRVWVAPDFSPNIPKV
jgi:Schlafen, AlbA_2